MTSAIRAVLSGTLLLIGREGSLHIWLAERVRQPIASISSDLWETDQYGRVFRAVWGPLSGEKGVEASQMLLAALTDRGFVHLLALHVCESQPEHEEALAYWWQLADTAPVDFVDWLEGSQASQGFIVHHQDRPETHILGANGIVPVASDDSIRSTWTLQPKRVASVALAVAKSNGLAIAQALDLAACPAGVLVASTEGWLECISWDGDTRWKVKIFQEAMFKEMSAEQRETSAPDGIQIRYDDRLRQCLLCFSPNWLVLLHLACGGYCRPHCVAPHARLHQIPGVCRAALEPRHGLIGLGMRNGAIRIHHLESMAEESVLCWNSWSRKTNDPVSAVRSLAWAPDGDALAVSWDDHGIALWSRHGCRLFSSDSLAEAGRRFAAPSEQSTSPALFTQRAHSFVWHPSALFLFLLSTASDTPAGSSLFWELPLLRLSGEFGGSSVWEGARVQPTACALTTDSVGTVCHRGKRREHTSFAAQAAAVLRHQFAGAFQKTRHRGIVDWRWFALDEQYLQLAWPVRHVAWQASTDYLAVAGAQGVALWNPYRQRWSVTELVMDQSSCVCIGLAWLGPFLLVLCRQAPLDTLLSEERFAYYAPTNVLTNRYEQASRLSSAGKPCYALQVFHRSRPEEQRLSKPLLFPHRPLKIDTLEPNLLCLYGSDCTIGFYQLYWDRYRSHASMVHWRLLHVVPVRVDYGLEQTSIDGEWLESFRVLPSRVLRQPTGAERAFLLPLGAWPGTVQRQETSPPATATCSKIKCPNTERDAGFASDVDLNESACSSVTDATADETKSALHIESETTIPREMLLLLGSRGSLFLLDPFTQAECVLARSVIRYWLDSHVGQRSGLPRPLVWVSSAQGIYAMGGARFQLRRCHEFDPETFVFGLLADEDVLIGAACSRTRDDCASAHPWKHDLHQVGLKGSPMLPMVLKHHLEDGVDDALLFHVALRNAHQPQFMDALEWLLYRSVVAERAPESANQVPLATRVVHILRKFGEYEDIVVHCARKTEAYKWPALFRLVGEPTVLLEQCFLSGRLRTAACLLIVLQELHGLQASAFQALRLFQAALAQQDDALARELRAYLMRLPAETIQPSLKLLSKSQDSFWSSWFRLTRRQPLDGAVTPTASTEHESSVEQQPSENPFLQMAETSLSMYATELLWRFDLYRLSVLAERVGFQLTDWLRSLASSRREITDFFLGITAARQQFRAGAPSVVVTERAIARIQTVCRAAQTAIESSTECAAWEQHEAESLASARATAAALAMPLTRLLRLQQLTEAARQADYPSLVLTLETLLLHGTCIYQVLGRYGEFREPYLNALSKFDETHLGALRIALQQALQADETQRA
jgi:hypothetical protein